MSAAVAPVRVLVGWLLALLGVAALDPVVAREPPPGTHTCPPSVVGQYQRVAAFDPDGPRGATLGFTPNFSPAAPLRLTVAQLGVAHGGELVPSELLPPDELSYTLGRPMRWTIWDGQSPEPDGVVHLVCEYEGGLVLHRPLGKRIRSCTLASAPLKVSGRSPVQRELAAKAVFSCR